MSKQDLKPHQESICTVVMNGELVGKLSQLPTTDILICETDSSLPIENTELALIRTCYTLKIFTCIKQVEIKRCECKQFQT
jgi:hypothetical protein